MPADNNDIDYIRERVLRKFPLLGVTMSALNTVADDNIGTAATDGHTVYYSPKFFAPLSDDEKTFIYAHEVMHVAFNHILRSKGKKQRLWNTATDAVINQILKNEELPMVDGGVDMAEAVNKSAEEMYEKLLKEQEEKKQENKQQKQGNDYSEQQPDSGRQQQNTPQPQEDNQQEQDSGPSQEQKNTEGEESEQAGHDNHEIWKEAVEREEKQRQQQEDSRKQKENSPLPKQEKSGQNLLDKLKDLFKKQNKPANQNEAENKETRQGSPDGTDSPRSKGNESVYEKRFAEDNRQERKRQAEQIRKALQQHKNEVLKAQSEEYSFGNVGEAKAVTDWKKLLKKTIEKEEDRWSYRRSGADNDYMARVEELEEENRSETEVMLDVSGSVNEDMLKEFLRQLKPILKTSKLKVGCFDHRIFGFKEIKNSRDIDNFRVPGGGGTNIDQAVRAFSKKKDVNKIVFTDGYSDDMPRQDLKNTNVIWLIYDNKNFNPVCGKVIYVDRSKLGQDYMKNAYFARGGR